MDRIAASGADVLWLMPIHPIGEKNRKGSLGSPYSIKDYRAVNSDLGTKADLKAFLQQNRKATGMNAIAAAFERIKS